MEESTLIGDSMNREQAEEAVKTILNYIEKTGIEDPPREGLERTPERVISMFDEIFSGNYDVVVTDGFTGNIALKSIEGVAGMIKFFIKEEFEKNIYNKISAVLSYPVMKGVKKKMDPRVYNGASLLGLNGIVVKSHGSADAFSYSNAIKTAYYEAKNNLLNNIKALIKKGLNE